MIFKDVEREDTATDGGDLGVPTLIHATTRAWLSQLGTHYVDYTLWVNGGHRAAWVVGHVHGREQLDDSHPSPDFILGEMLLGNGVRAYLDCGYLSPQNLADEAFWVDDRLSVYGTHGYAWAEANGRWAACTRRTTGRLDQGEDEPWLVQEKQRLQTLYARDFADWLDDDDRVHPCNVAISYHGYEILEGLCLSALDHTRIDLPLDPEAHEPAMERMRAELGPAGPLP